MLELGEALKPTHIAQTEEEGCEEPTAEKMKFSRRRVGIVERRAVLVEAVGKRQTHRAMNKAPVMIKTYRFSLKKVIGETCGGFGAPATCLSRGLIITLARTRRPRKR